MAFLEMLAGKFLEQKKEHRDASNSVSENNIEEISSQELTEQMELVLEAISDQLQDEKLFKSETENSIKQATEKITQNKSESTLKKLEEIYDILMLIAGQKQRLHIVKNKADFQTIIKDAEENYTKLLNILNLNKK